MYHHLLVHLDDTDLAADIVGRAVELARTLGARITFFHAQGDRADDVSVRRLLTKAESAANAQGVPCASASQAGAPPWQAIMSAARETGCDLIYMASDGGGGEAGTAADSTLLEVLSGAAVPVLVDSMKNSPASTLAIDIIRYEHRSLAAVQHAWLHLVRKAAANGGPVSPGLMHSMVVYLRDFPLALHHPKEEKYLFATLRQRTSHFDAELSELERQHEHDRKLVTELDAAVEQFAQGKLAVADIEALVGRYATFMWEHMGREEGVIIPAARRYLTIEDWEAVNAAFKDNRDPRLGEDLGAKYRGLFERILEQLGN